jgi:hypothetical protein
MDFVRMNGSAVRTTSVYERVIPQEGGPPLQEIELVIILRGTMEHRTFLALLGRGQVRIEIPDRSGASWTVYDTEVVTAYSSSSSMGEGAAHRHDVTLRETPDSAARRAAERAAQQPEPEPATATPPPAPDPEPEVDDDPDAPVDFSAVTVGSDASVWAAALRQMTTPGGSKPAAPPEPPLETAELAGAEAVLVGLRLEALIEQLTAVGIIRRSNVDASFMRLVRQRFVAEATPVIGQKAAERVAKSVVEE